MPEGFRLSVNFFSQLVPPQTFFDVQESHLYHEEISKLDMPNSVGLGWAIPGVGSAASIDNLKVSFATP